jgi:glycosyltransferase involved in cell wall biosynthesis
MPTSFDTSRRRGGDQSSSLPEYTPLAPLPGLPPFLSVIVCSYNRAARLRICIASLLRMNVPPGVSWELICVDNNSTDETPAVVEDFARIATVPVRYVFERRQGLSFARNAGMRHADGELIAMTDDDCIVDADWIAHIIAEFQRRPILDVLGGRVEMFEKNSPALAVRRSTNRIEATATTIFGLVPGNNMSFRRRVAERIGFFDTRLGPPFPVADDADYAYRAFAAKLEAAYAPEPLVYHAHARLTEADLRKSQRDYVLGRGAFYAKHIARGDRHVLRMAYWEIHGLWRSVLREAGSSRTEMGNVTVLRYLVMGALSYGWFMAICALRGGTRNAAADDLGERRLKSSR